MAVMEYKLPDGTKIDFSNVSEISEIKDYGNDENKIAESTLSFTIRMIKGHSVRVTKNYHFNDWFDIFKELRKIRADVIKHWEKSKSPD
jgi:hypothetical protein